jgi:hypothetical protein
MNNEINIKHPWPTAIASNRPDSDHANCKKHNFYGTNIVECQENKDCEWAMHFGNSRFCKHPAALQQMVGRFASALPNGGGMQGSHQPNP